MTLGQKIKEARIRQGMTQKQLVGDYITRNMLSKIENDSATPSVRTLEYLARALETPVSYFMEDAELSDGSSPDGLDNMRDAYRAGKWEACIKLLQEARPAGTTDEGYLLHARAGAAAAREALARGDMAAAVGFAEAADYYNKEGIYYSHRIDAEMSLIMAESVLLTGEEDFETQIRNFERAVVHIDYFDRYILDKAEYLLNRGDEPGVKALLDNCGQIKEPYKARRLYLEGRLLLAEGSREQAESRFLEAEAQAADNPILLSKIYKQLELCYKELDDYKKAYLYAAKQRELQCEK